MRRKIEKIQIGKTKPKRHATLYLLSIETMLNVVLHARTIFFLYVLLYYFLNFRFNWMHISRSMYMDII